MIAYQKQRKIMDSMVLFLLAGLLVWGNVSVFILTYIFVFVFMMIRALRTKWKKATKLYFFVAYTVLLALQINFCLTVVFGEHILALTFYISKAFAILLLALPLMIERYITVDKYVGVYLPSLQEMSTIGFYQMRENKERILGAIEGLGKVKGSMSAENLETVLSDLRRHSLVQYINNSSLTDEYFDLAYRSLADPYLYIAISNTGSAASEIISVFTNKQYNHASLSFDYELKTIISYNGGERVYPPGLNHEMINFFNQKEDASILVYRLPVTEEQKRIIIDKVKEINVEGSAYNLMGLITKYSHKPNIMFCSQFVYNMLKLANLQYFDKQGGRVIPTDLIELDYYRKLEFAYEISFKN